MAVRGGYQQPSNPAPVSGPGSMSQRTDGGPADAQPIRVAPGGAYGDRQAMEELQASAPMAQAPAAPRATVDVTPFTAPTADPSQPVTSGVDVGPGPGSDALGARQGTDGSLASVLRKISGNDPTGDVSRLLEVAARRGW